MDAVAIGAEGEECALVQQAGQVEIRALADQLDVETIGLADGLAWRQMTPSAFGLFIKEQYSADFKKLDFTPTRKCKCQPDISQTLSMRGVGMDQK